MIRSEKSSNITLNGFLVSLIFPVIFLYPQGIFYGSYFNYLFIIVISTISCIRGFTINEASKYLFALFLLNLFSNIISLIIGNINLDLFIKGNTITLCTMLVAFSTSKKDLPLLLYSIYVTSLIVVILICIDGLVSPSWMYTLFSVKEENELTTGSMYYRAVGPLLSPVSAGFFCSSVIVFFFAKMHYSKVKILDLMFLFTASLALFLTTSRTSFIALGLAIIYYFTVIKFNIKIIISIIIIGITFSIYSNKYLSSQIENLKTRNEQLNENPLKGTGRLETINSALENKFDIRCFFWGIGSSQYSIVENKEFSLAHNGFLSIFLPMGIIGLILYYKITKYLYQQWRINIELSIKKNTIYLFSRLWVILFLGTFFSSDAPITMFGSFILSFILISVTLIKPNNQHNLFQIRNIPSNN